MYGPSKANSRNYKEERTNFKMGQPYKIKSFSGLVFLPLLILVSENSILAQPISKSGDPVIPFELTDLNGFHHSTEKYLGKILVLWFIGHD